MRSEFEFILNIKKKYGLNRVGDDCAVLPKDSKTDLIITADMLVEDIDFRLEWTTPEFLGHKALAVSLSDIAAMGAKPVWALLSIGVPKRIWRSKFLDRFYKGWFDLARTHDVDLVGGDVSKTSEAVVIDSIVGGEVRKGRAISRSGAKPGDSIFVTGSIGGAAGGLKLLESGSKHSKGAKKHKELIARQLRPTPRVDAGEFLGKRDIASAMIDISDGLAADLYHLCDSSGVGAQIDFDKVPLDPSLDSIALLDKFRFAIAGGEDFELLFTSNRKNIFRAISTPVTRIGEITANAGMVTLVTGDSIEILSASGYRHF